jgi:N-acetylneuraminate lyase
MVSSFHGILPAVVTPFDQGERFNATAFERLLERLYAQGIHGIYVCGSTGEGLLQSVWQRKQVAEVAVRCSPKGKQVILHVGAHNTEDAVELTRHAARIGIQAVSSLPPSGSYSFAEIRSYYQAVAAVSDVPVLVYYFPEICPTVSSTEEILELCEIPNVVGLKFTDLDLYMMSILRRHGHLVFNGRDEVLVAGRLMGANGGIGSFYNLVPELFLQVYALTESGHWKEARAIQDRINELIEIVLRFPGIPAIKTMLAWSGIDCGQCLKPRRTLNAGEESQLRTLLSASTFAESAWLEKAV